MYLKPVMLSTARPRHHNPIVNILYNYLLLFHSFCIKGYVWLGWKWKKGNKKGMKVKEQEEKKKKILFLISEN